MTPLTEAINALILAKKAEAEANAARIACEQRLIALIEKPPEVGRSKLSDGVVKATVEFKLNYGANVDAIRAIDSDNLPLKRRPESYELDVRAYEELRERDPVLFAKVAQHVTTKPAKPSVELKL